MSPTCVASDPAQPNLPIYGFDVLQRVPLFTRASYLAAFGVQAPNFDVSRPAKYWFDSSADVNGAYKYQAVNAVGNFTEQEIPGAEAAAVNIPGLMTYPPYEIEPTSAAVVGTNGSRTAIQAMNLCTYQDAVKLVASMGLPVSAILDGSGFVYGPFSVDYAGDSRRLYMISWKAGMPPAQFAGNLIALMNAQGVGAPGKWDLTGDSPAWVTAAPGPDGITADVPTTSIAAPVRSLLPNEGLIATLFAKEIGRRDLLPSWYFPA